MTDRSTWTFVALAALLVVVAGAMPLLADARPAYEIPSPTVEDDLDGTDASGWEDVPAAEVPLESAPSGLPNAEMVSTRSVEVQAARSDGEVYLRMQWQDEEASESASAPQAFADAVAVQIPADPGVQPAIAMGSQSNLVNVWYWNADTGTEELLAGGQGSTTEFEDASVQTWAEHTGSGEDGTWTVVFNRPVDPAGDNRTAITGGEDLDIAFGVWDGGNAERSGHKAVSEWYYLPLAGDSGGPPFESILWAIAGIAIVAVVVVTIQGIRRVRTGGGE
ncbi:ethylbenzene dehydrogenase-related protein [Halapricum hydrolyticum]|uniref:Ethylbenzene dehydrogenase-related protein n=1 Tax=Halapricum hydrolyticum TaxID=2979991 RepID=A0AAE3I8S0_9EURY|nr:ethylbenzene dehydrogenase-related protein [Halapricum hydrolyticum]MCU4716954.1 ethylbenzene dehydrogenase-related protein [Halapricum hydrolyticum]MCU4725441.1 ethylbenzene dehydrogenase-related protein [Halapricum hydrolyticum]